MTNSILRSIVDRILSLKGQQDDLTDDIKEVYAEAVSNGYNKARLGEVVTILRKRAKDPAAFEERSRIVEIYLDEIEAPRAHTRAREARKEPDATPAGAVVAARSGVTAGETAPKPPDRGPPYDDLEIPANLRRLA